MPGEQANMTNVSTSAAVTTVVETPSTSSAAVPPVVSSVSDRVSLRLTPRRKKKGVRWVEETVDNEGMGKKSSKKCCIFHRRRAFGDWSDDEDSDFECDCNKDQQDGEGSSGQKEGAGSSHSEPSLGS
uniref:Protein phosphatase 1 regulatory subunit 11 n=1 Tax=Tetraselmis sp. GSL018 TaxID=582737 RepID=A0A061SA72_9CHLO